MQANSGSRLLIFWQRGEQTRRALGTVARRTAAAGGNRGVWEYGGAAAPGDSADAPQAGEGECLPSC